MSLLVLIARRTGKTMMGEYTGMDRFVGTTYVQEAARIKLTQNLGNPPL